MLRGSILALGVLLLFSASFAFAGESYDVDFTSVRTQAVYLYEDDELRFALLGDEHVIIIEDVGTSSVKLDIGPFLGNGTMLYPGLLGLDYIMRLDLDKDGVTDVNVALYSISAEGQVHLVLQDVTGEENEATAVDVGLVDNGAFLDTKTMVLSGIGVLLLVFVLIVVFRNENQKKDTRVSEPVASEGQEKLGKNS